MGAMDGIKVAEFAWGGAGPLATKSLAAHGAEVVRVETGSVRFMGGIGESIAALPGEGAQDRSTGISANKRNISVDLKHPRGLEVAKRLIAWADIMTESFSPGTSARMGLGYEEVKKIKPDIIMMSVSIQGQGGPHGKHPGFAIFNAGITGLVQLAGWPDRAPAHPGNFTDMTTPRFGAALLLGALEYRRRTGRGLYIDLSQFEATLHLLAVPVLRYLVNQEETLRAGNVSPCAAPHGVYRCRGEERWCAITVFTDSQWKAFCRVVADPALSEDPRFETLLGRKEHEAALNLVVERWTQQHTPEEVMTLLQEAGVPAGIVSSVADIYHDPQLQFRNHYQSLEDPLLGSSPLNRGESFTLSETPGKLVRPSPSLGFDNALVCRDFLGYTEAEYQELVAVGALA